MNDQETQWFKCVYKMGSGTSDKAIAICRDRKHHDDIPYFVHHCSTVNKKPEKKGKKKPEKKSNHKKLALS